MQQRTMGKLGHQVSLLGFGAMRLPILDGDSKKIDVPEAIRMIRHGIDQGITYVDTAWGYHGGESEPTVGLALADGYRDRVFLATKNPTWLIQKPEDWEHYLDQQLERLGTDHIDFYLQHALSSEGWKKFKEMNLFEQAMKAKAAGKIRHFGFSFHDKHEVFMDILQAYDWDFCQIQYNYLDTEYQAGMAGLQAAAAKGIPVIIMEPIRGGSLAANLPAEISSLLTTANPMRTPVQWAIRWLADQPEVTVVLSGMSMMQHVEQNLATCSEEELSIGCMSEADKAVLTEVSKTWHARIKVDCTSCEYCMPCPQGVNIPGCFSRYNTAAMFDTWERAKQGYAQLCTDQHDASLCIACGACEAACPQHLPIIEKLAELDKALR